MKKLFFNITLISLLYTNSFGEEPQIKHNYSGWVLAGTHTAQGLQLGIIQHNYINLSWHNEHSKYTAFIGITLAYNEWLELNFLPINFIITPLSTSFLHSMYFTLSLAIYIFKYQIHMDSVNLAILIGPQISTSLRSAIFAGYTTSAFLYPAFPMLTIKLNLALTHRYSLAVKFASSFNEYFLIDTYFIFTI
ncbi:hypothetical protein [Candidatus Borreliella tachyglossi]|uniref:hypothetical protein n=1 Tax=Candidatus Borreliella tachyglossi TaxID=1964448 RepID=UPI0040429B8A